MSTDLLLNLLIFSTVLTIALTQLLKKLLNAVNAPYRANAVALDSAMVSCTGVAVLYRLQFGLGFEPVLLFRLLALILLTWLVSMTIYDRIIQFINQYRQMKEHKE